MKYIIKNILGEVIIEEEGNSLKEVVEKNKANLRGADLRGAIINPSQKDDLLKAIGIIII